MCDKHIVKMVLEYSQLLCTAHKVLEGNENPILYKQTHINHPCVKWVTDNPKNYMTLTRILNYCLSEYHNRYKKTHKIRSSGLEDYLWNNVPNDNLYNYVGLDKPLCMPEYCKINNDLIESYRNYYNLEKSKFAKWKNGNIPYWYKKES